ncbi:hypothetical protein chiPu_0020545, partial [Chiloscyllium punctatum]|nr:hypothetical protein [Chiloscyllium punctatum]
TECDTLPPSVVFPHSVCEYESALIGNGQMFHPIFGGPCIQCTCSNGDVQCQEEICPPLICSNPFRDPGQCCPTCTVCIMQGLEYEDGAEWELEESQCTTCTCANGNVTCRPKHCPPVSCLHPSLNNGNCCPSCDQCTYNKRQYRNGQEFIDPDNPCQNCHCQSGTVRCTPTDCLPTSCTRPERKAGQCCAKCPDCMFEGRVLLDGQRFPNPVNPCQECTCVNGQVTCEKRDCISALSPPSECRYNGLLYQHMQRFYDPSDACRSCICNNGTITCQRKPCAPLQCSHPILQDCCRTCDGCLFGGKEFANGEQFADVSDSCNVCVCREGSVSCERTPCPVLECPFPTQGPCCRVCDGCNYMGEEYLNGQEFPGPLDPCSRCECISGFVSCSRRPCYSPGCSHPINLPGQCCPVCEGCYYGGVTIGNGQTFADPTDTCSQCSCRSGSVHCVRALCAPAPCSHPIIGRCDCPQCDGE